MTRFEKINENTYRSTVDPNFRIERNEFDTYDVINEYDVRDYTGITLGDSLDWIDIVSEV